MILTSTLKLPPFIGHRGTAGLAPENTLAGIRRAHQEGASWVEFDVKLTADNVAILMHDDRLERTTDGEGKVAETAYNSLQKLDAGGGFARAFTGEPVPTFEDALRLCIELGLGVNVELKPCPGRDDETAEIVLEQLLAIWPDDGTLPPPLVSSFEKKSLAAAQALAPDLPRGCLVGRVPLSWRKMVERYDCRTLNVSDRWISVKHVEAAEKLGLPVLVYTVNDPVRALQLWDMGVTSIFTDRVDLMTTARQEWGSS